MRSQSHSQLKNDKYIVMEYTNWLDHSVYNIGAASSSPVIGKMFLVKFSKVQQLSNNFSKNLGYFDKKITTNLTADTCRILFHTAIFITVVSPAVLAHDVSARAGDVSMGSPSFLLVGFTWGHSRNWETVELPQRSISVQPVRKKVKSLKHVKLRVDT